MPATAFENLKSVLKAHPEARPIPKRRRNADQSPETTQSFAHQPALDRHRRKCQICHHPCRCEIEADFLHWRSSAEIAKEFGIADHSAICRHARATGLRNQRQRTVAYALHPILEQADDIFLKTTASAIVSAVRTYSQINDEGRRLRTKPVTNVYIKQSDAEFLSSNPDLQFAPGLKRVLGSAVAASSHSPLITSHSRSRQVRIGSNRPIPELEDDSTH